MARVLWYIAEGSVCPPKVPCGGIGEQGVYSSDAWLCFDTASQRRRERCFLP